MSMSTPLNQLGAGQNNPTFVNDAQRQMVTNAQAAAQNYQMPQLSENAMMVEDDSVVNDVLNQYNQGNQQSQSQSQSQQHEPQIIHAPSAPNAQMPPMYYAEQLQALQSFEPSNASNQLQDVNPMTHSHSSTRSPTAFLFDRDFKIAMTVAIAFIILSILPVEKYIYRYVAIEKIPYAGILVKAVLAAGLVYVVAKMQP